MYIYVHVNYDPSSVEKDIYMGGRMGRMYSCFWIHIQGLLTIPLTKQREKYKAFFSFPSRKIMKTKHNPIDQIYVNNLHFIFLKVYSISIALLSRFLQKYFVVGYCISTNLY